jgi:micrococcal nuclease
VLRVVDGDTLEVRSPVDGLTERVRLVGIDAPERTECWADEATAALTLQAGRMVTLERDVSDRDRYGRLLRSIRDAAGQDVAGALLDGGHVIARSYPPDTTRDAEYRVRQESARTAGLGLWAEDACGAVGPRAVADSIGITIQADPPGDDTLVPNDEWVAFTNLGSSDLDLTEWQVRDESASHRYRFGRTVLAPGEHVTLHTGCGMDSVTDRHWCVTGSAVLNNGGDTVFLLDPLGTMVTWLAYGSSLAGSPSPSGE